MNCTAHQEGYGAPMPWIGLYVAVASTACFIAMLADHLLDRHRRQAWLPCKLFSLNATSLTLLAIATKLPGDLSTPMPKALEQVSKLSGTSLICIAMALFMPSIGSMKDSQVITNLLALVILVITVMVDICIEIVTGVIRAFKPEHIITLCFMLLMLLFTCSSALAIPTMKGLLRQQLELKCQEMQHIRQQNEPPLSTIKSLKEDINKYMTMALSSNPQYVLSRSNLGFAAGIVCCCQALILIEAIFRAIFLPVCKNKSHSVYEWSIPFIVSSQASAVVLGAYATYLRTGLGNEIRSVRIREFQHHQNQPSVDAGNRSLQTVGRYWIQNLVECKDKPILAFDIQNRCCLRFVHGSRNLVLKILRWLQEGVVKFAHWFKETLSGFLRGIVMYRNPSVCEQGANNELRTFVLYLEGEDKLVDFILHLVNVNVKKWKEKERPVAASLIDLLKMASDDYPSFVGEPQFHDANLIQEPSNCWALSLMTLTSIALAIPCTQGDRIKQLLKDGVSEGLTYVRNVDKGLDSQGQLKKVREAADVIWAGVHLYNQWLDVDLAKFASKKEAPKYIIERLEEKGSSYEAEVESLVNGKGDMKSGLRWPPRALALYSMANICKNILDIHSKFNIDNADELFKQLQLVISDMLGVCLANLPRAQYMQCYDGSMKAKEGKVMDAARLLSAAENILKALPTEGLVVNQGKYVERWSSFMPNWSDLPRISPVNEPNVAV